MDLLLFVFIILGIVLIALFFAVVFSFVSMNGSVNQTEQALTASLSALSASLTNLGAFITNGFSSVAVQAGNLIGQSAAVIETLGGEALSQIGILVTSIYTWMSQVFQEGIRAIGDAYTSIIQAIEGIIPFSLTDVENFINKVISTLLSDILCIVQSIFGILSQIIDFAFWIMKQIFNVVEEIVFFIITAICNIYSMVSNITFGLIPYDPICPLCTLLPKSAWNSDTENCP